MSKVVMEQSVQTCGVQSEQLMKPEGIYTANNNKSIEKEEVLDETMMVDPRIQMTQVKQDIDMDDTEDLTTKTLQKMDFCFSTYHND